MVHCQKCGYERTEADSQLACPRCSVAYSKQPLSADPAEQVICPKCGYVRTAADPRTACRTCGVVYVKLPIKPSAPPANYAVISPNDGVVYTNLSVGGTPNEPVICQKCNYERKEVDPRLACPKCGVVYTNTNAYSSSTKVDNKYNSYQGAKRVLRVAARSPRHFLHGFTLRRGAIILVLTLGAMLFNYFYISNSMDSLPSKGDYLASMNGRWTDGSEIILVNAANGKLYAMTDKGLAIIFEPTTGVVSNGAMDAKTTTFPPIGSNPLDKISDVMGLSLAESSAVAIKNSNEFSGLKVKMDNAAIEIKNGEKKDGYINGYGGRQLRAGMNFDVNKRVTFDNTFNLTFDRKLTNEEIGVLNEFAKDPAKGLKQNVAIDNVVAEFLSNTQKRAELFMQQKVALEKIAPDVRSIVSNISKVLPQQLERDEAWDVLGLKAPPSITGVTKLSFKKNLALEFTLPSEAFGSSCILHTEPKSLGQSPIPDWGVWLSGVNCQDNKVTEAAITDVFEAKQTMEPKFTVVKL